MTGPKYDELWRAAMHTAFPGSTGKRSEVSRELESLRKLRNRIAHHDSMLNIDVLLEVRRIHRVATFLGPVSAEWLESLDRTSEVYRERPHSVIDTVVVPAVRAWSVYLEHHAYICQANRVFQRTDRMAFYAAKVIQPEIPRILYRRDNVIWTLHEARRLAASGDRNDRKIAALITASLTDGWREPGEYQVFLLSRTGDPQHRTLADPVPNWSAGLGSAFVRKQRYVSLHRLETAGSTEDVV